MHGVFAEDADGRYRLTPAAELLRTAAEHIAFRFETAHQLRAAYTCAKQRSPVRW